MRMTDLTNLSNLTSFSMRGFSDIDDETVCLDEIETYVSQNHCCAAFPLFQLIRNQGKLCDVILVADSREFHAHRVVLAATIPYFHGMFTHNMLESTKKKIPIHGMEASALEALINYAYCGDVQITPSNVQSILMGASFLQLLEVCDACCEYIKNRLCAQSVLSVRVFAQSFLCSQLLEATSQFIYENFELVVNTPDFVNVNFDDLLCLLASDDLRVSSEEKVFEAALVWLRHDLPNRDIHVVALLKCIRLPLLSPQYLTDKVSAEEVIRCNIECRDLLDEARDFLLLPERRASLRTFRCQPRRTPILSGYIYVMGGMMPTTDSISMVERYDPIHDRWHLLENKAIPRSRVGVAVLQGYLYALGGFDGANRLRTVEKFDPIANKWLSVAPMNYQRSALGAAGLDGRLYVCGGFDGSTSMRTCEVYYPEGNIWCMIPSMNDSRSAGGVVALGNRIYAIGGHNGLAIYDTVEYFDINNAHDLLRLADRPSSSSSSSSSTLNSMNIRSPLRQTSAGAASSSSASAAYRTVPSTSTAKHSFPAWRQLAPMLTRRCRLGVAALRDKIFVAGGYNGVKFLQSVECYNPQSNQWTRMAAMTIPRSRVALCATFGRLYAIGGYDGAANLKSVEVFDEESNCWRQVSSLRYHEGGVVVGVVPIHELPAPVSSTSTLSSSSKTTTAARSRPATMAGNFLSFRSAPPPTVVRGMSNPGVLPSSSSSSGHSANQITD